MNFIKKLGLLLCTVIIFFAVSCGRDKKQPEQGSQVSINENNVEAEPTEVPEETYYDVRLENNTLCLYEVRQRGRTLIKSVNIDTSYYPDEDIEELKSGISAYSKESGFEILENFVN